jgi:hypothetical protein
VNQLSLADKEANRRNPMGDHIRGIDAVKSAALRAVIGHHDAIATAQKRKLVQGLNQALLARSAASIF